MSEDTAVKSYKGFDADLKCRGFQFEVGKEYHHQGNVLACWSGFHSCEYPLEVFSYYPPIGNRFAIVCASGNLSRNEGDSKMASSDIAVIEEIDLHRLSSIAVDWVIDRLDLANLINQIVVTGNQSAATNTGDQSAATNTGYRSAATNTGDRSAATNTGYRSAATNTGHQSVATNTGDQSAATNTGYQSAATNTGYQSAATNTGDQSAATNTGHQSVATNTGYQSAAKVKGANSVAVALGINCRASASVGGAIVLCYRDECDGTLIHLRASKVGENGIRPDTWYSLNKNGEFFENE